MKTIFEDVGSIDIGECFSDHENVIEFEKGSKTATVTLCQGRYISRIKKLADKHPDDVEIIAVNYRGENISSIVAHIPSGWVKINPPKQIEISDERREELAERFRNLRNAEHSKAERGLKQTKTL